MKTLVYIVRHGESEGNRQKQFLGHTDGVLSELGTRQAVLAGEYLRGIGVRPNAVYASDLCRAYETARRITEVLGQPDPVPTCGFREIYAGEWEGKPVELLKRQYADDFSCWLHTVGLSRPTGGESVKELSARVRETLSLCVSLCRPKRTGAFRARAGDPISNGGSSFG